jgi:hypothetical protein
LESVSSKVEMRFRLRNLYIGTYLAGYRIEGEHTRKFFGLRVADCASSNEIETNKQMRSKFIQHHQSPVTNCGMGFEVF